MSGPAPRFSVLLPTHNRADVLGFAIASVLAQTEPDFELLIVADGCTDGTKDVVTSFADPRIRLFDLPKAPGFGYAARNVALRQARGRLVAFAPHDDILLPDHLALMADVLERDGVAWAYSRPLWVSTEGVIVPLCTNLQIADEKQTFMEQVNLLPAACVDHTRAVLEQVGYWPEDVTAGGDWVLWKRMLHASGGRLAHLRQPTTLHFTADWRRGQEFQGLALRVMFALADRSAWWPEILRHPPGQEVEQAVVWHALQTGGNAAWVQALRAAVDSVIDRTAWMAVCGMLASAEGAVAAKDKAEAEAELAVCRAELAAFLKCARP